MTSPAAIPPRPCRARARRRGRAAALRLAATSLVAAVLAGCSLFGGSDAATPTTTATSSTTSTTQVPIARSEPPVLLDPGEEPRRALRLAYSEGDEARITFTSDLEITQETEGRTQRIDSPPVAQTLVYVVGPVTDQGADLTIRIEAIAAKGKGTGLTEEELAALDDELAPLVGLETTATISPLGEMEDLSFATPDDLPEPLADQLDALEAQLPTLGPALPMEEVGVGASWRSTATSSTGGIAAETTSTVTVTAIADGRLEYRTEIRTTAEPQAVQLDGLAEGTTAQLESSELSGTSTGVLGLDRLEVSLRTELGGTQRIALATGSSTTDLSQAVELAYVAATEPN
jgi:hypothetical protein